MNTLSLITVDCMHWANYILITSASNETWSWASVNWGCTHYRGLPLWLCSAW